MSNGNVWRNLWAGLMVALMAVLVGSTIQLHQAMGDFRVEVERRFSEMERRIAGVELEMERRFGEVNERLARIETLLQRLDPDPPPSAGNGGS